MCLLYSPQVVAAIVRNVPRASAGLSRFAASPLPSRPARADEGVRFVNKQNYWLGRYPCLVNNLL